jgi:hypothetical protein
VISISGSSIAYRQCSEMPGSRLDRKRQSLDFKRQFESHR